MPHKLEPISTIVSTPYVLDAPNIDTDQIIPARFLTTTSRDGMGELLFNDWRGEDGAFTPALAAQSKILVAAENFGCGSSREHAAWAISDFGFRAVLSPLLADIFRANALKNGLLAVEIVPSVYDAIAAQPDAQIEIDLESQTIKAAGQEAQFDIDPFARRCLLDGVDAMGFLTSRISDIEAFEKARA